MRVKPDGLRERLVEKLLDLGVSLDGTRNQSSCPHDGCKEHPPVYDSYVDHPSELVWPIVDTFGDLIPSGLQDAAQGLVDEALRGVQGLHPKKAKRNAEAIADAILDAMYP